MSFVFDRGDEVTVGSQGQNDTAYSAGEPIPDNGVNDFVFEDGVGLGGELLKIGGTNVGFFRTSNTHSEFMNYRSTCPNAEGWLNFGVADYDGRATYLFGHYSTATDTYSLNMWSCYPQESTYTAGDHDTLWEGFGGIALNPTDPAASDGPAGGRENDVYETYNGDPACGHDWAWNCGDGVSYEFEPNQSFTVNWKFADVGTYTSRTEQRTDKETGDRIRARGPNNNDNFSWIYGTTLDIEVVV